MTDIDITVTLHLPHDTLHELAEALTERVGVPPTTRWLDVDGAAEHLATTADAMRKAAQRRQIPSHQPFGPGSRYLFDRDELDAWVRETSHGTVG